MHIIIDNETSALDDIHTLASAIEDICIFIPEAPTPEPLCRIVALLARGIDDFAAGLKE
ncbi:hypothetical protein [Desulfovibrio gilichinskyi]|uniref:Uncharacterized protein n=1 Tax=Desulfovibrio gilichinskyi TaxID=1519643 RepID=A0A1X7C3Q4_9BACT|nr:hypothetical protein [Desulfovibrio gilichinskyi]SME89439.1 hypothetical protein SAMN06295933_0302 [Desulfovibrio gilichinskyi]